MTRLLWLDLETTGLNPDSDLILEIGLVATERLDRILDSVSIVIDHGAIHMPPEVLDLHLGNGLLQDIGKRGVKPGEAHVQAIRFLDSWFPGDDPIVVGGSGIDRFDIPFLKAAGFPLDALPDRFYYGTLDTSGLKRIAKMAGATDLEGRGGATHRAVEDATDSFHLAQRFASLVAPVIP